MPPPPTLFFFISYSILYFFSSLIFLAIEILPTSHIPLTPPLPLTIKVEITANAGLLKIVPVKILLNFGNYFRTLQLGF